MKYSRVMSRRTLFKGAGTILIGLPFLEEMRIKSAFAQPAAPPIRGFNLFHGLGYPMPIQTEGFEGKGTWIKTLDPLAPLKAKFSMLRGVNQTMADHADNSHYDGAAAAFSGTKQLNKNTNGGISVDQALRRAAYPQGLPAGMVPALSGGVYFRRSDSTNRYTHSRNADGSPVEITIDNPADLFTRVFGTAPPMATPTPMPGAMPTPAEAAAARAQRLRKSVLDSVTGQYRHFMSDAGNLSAASRARVSTHLEAIRELEARIFVAPAGPGGPGVPAITPSMRCKVPTAPVNKAIPVGRTADPGGSGIDITVENLVGQWRLIADVFAMGIKCDRARFGTAVFQGAGERIRLTGAYQANGAMVYDFDDKRDRGGSGVGATSHEYWHAYNEAAENRPLRAHLSLMMREIGYLMGLLDAPDSIEENGKSILDNSMVIVSTESGDGRHNDSKRELSGVLHLITSANGRFKTGEIIDVNEHGINLYNSMLAAHGFPRSMGAGGGTMITSIMK